MNKEPLKKNLTNIILTIATSIAGCGILLLPTRLASIGSISILGITMSMFFTLITALVFAKVSIMVKGDDLSFRKMSSIGHSKTVSMLTGFAYTASVIMSCYYLGFLQQDVLVQIFGETDYMPYLISSIYLVLWTVLELSNRERFFDTCLVLGLTIKSLVILLAIVTSLFYFDWSNILANFNVSGLDDWTVFQRSVIATVMCFGGFESAVMFKDVAENPERNLPIATVIGTILGSGLYIIMMLLILGSFDVSQIQIEHLSVAGLFLKPWNFLPTHLTILLNILTLLSGCASIGMYIFGASSLMEQHIIDAQFPHCPKTKKRLLRLLFAFLMILSLGSRVVYIPEIVVQKTIAILASLSYLGITSAFLIFSIKKSKRVMDIAIGLVSTIFSSVMIIVSLT